MTACVKTTAAGASHIINFRVPQNEIDSSGKAEIMCVDSETQKVTSILKLEKLRQQGTYRVSLLYDGFSNQ